MMNTFRKIITVLTVLVLISTMTACSALTGSKDAPAANSSSGYYRGHYGLSGWDDSVSDKTYTKSSPVFTGSQTQ